jgi:tRNA threonylcarbamoyl adenosine modification protein YeaZ
MLLAIDTSLGTAVAVVDRDRGVLAELSDPGRDNHASVIGSLIGRVLEISETEPSALSGVAVGMGPGPSVSLSAGIAAAHGFATALHKPVVRVVSHDAVALDRDRPSLIVTDAGKGGLAWTAYGPPDPELGLPTRNTDPALSVASDIVDLAGYAQYERIDVQEISAGSLGMLAERLFAGKRPFARKEPYYVHSADGE